MFTRKSSFVTGLAPKKVRDYSSSAVESKAIQRKNAFDALIQSELSCANSIDNNDSIDDYTRHAAKRKSRRIATKIPEQLERLFTVKYTDEKFNCEFSLGDITVYIDENISFVSNDERKFSELVRACLKGYGVKYNHYKRCWETYRSEFRIKELLPLFLSISTTEFQLEDIDYTGKNRKQTEWIQKKRTKEEKDRLKRQSPEEKIKEEQKKLQRLEYNSRCTPFLEDYRRQFYCALIAMNGFKSYINSKFGVFADPVFRALVSQCFSSETFDTEKVKSIEKVFGLFSDLNIKGTGILNGVADYSALKEINEEKNGLSENFDDIDRILESEDNIDNDDFNCDIPF